MVRAYANFTTAPLTHSRARADGNTSVARMIFVIQFTFDPRLSQPPDYQDSCAPPIKISLLWRLSIIVRGHRIANNTRRHSEKTST